MNSKRVIAMIAIVILAIIIVIYGQVVWSKFRMPAAESEIPAAVIEDPSYPDLTIDPDVSLQERETNLEALAAEAEDVNQTRDERDATLYALEMESVDEILE